MVDSSANTDSTPREEVTKDNVELIFGFPLDKLYKTAVKFYKENEKTGTLNNVLEYQTRLKFMAYGKQARHGEFKEELADVGWFDFIGHDAKNEWKKLGNISREEAMIEFVKLLDGVCINFRPFVKEKAALEAPKQLNGVSSKQLFNGNFDSKEVQEKYQQQKKQIQEALNHQTYHQFLAYAQQTYPGEPTKQQELIAQLQEEHFNQYMSQIFARQAQAQADSLETNANNGKESESSDSEAGPKPPSAYLQQGLERPPAKVRTVNDEGAAGDDSDATEEDAQDDQPSNPKIAPASLWNSKNIVEFKEAIRKEGTDGIIKVGHGESVTVRVPTHEDGTCLFWEFATDYYDIGFGVYFEWTVAQSNQITVHISESDEEDEDEEIEGAGANPADDVEGAAASRPAKPRDPSKPQVDEVIPIYRRACHEEVYAGSHPYPGRGVYLLKFDNTYSLWRSKTLYYRVFYSK